jgi:hypothetical protein
MAQAGRLTVRGGLVYSGLRQRVLPVGDVRT